MDKMFGYIIPLAQWKKDWVKRNGKFREFTKFEDYKILQNKSTGEEKGP